MAASDLSLNDLQLAAQRRDPAFVQMLHSFLQQDDPYPPDGAPEGSMSLWDLKYNTLSSWELRRLTPGEPRMEYRQQKWSDYLAQDFPLPERLQLDELMLNLQAEKSEWGRQVLLRLITTLPLKYGPWRAFKTMFKRAEETHDFELLGAIAMRCDVEMSSKPHNYEREVTVQTLGYLRRRAWRYLRHLGQNIPELYCSAAIQFLRWIPEFEYWYTDDYWRKMWIANHIFFHEHKKKGGGKYYGRTKFKYGSWSNKPPEKVAKYRAFPELWEESPAPLMDLLLLGQSSKVTQFAIELLRSAFKKQMRELPLEQLIRLGQRPLGPIQSFVKELIEENPSWQRSNFKELGLHDLVLKHFLLSADEDVRKYAIKYAQDFASDMSVEELLKLLETEHDDLHTFAGKLLGQRDPREDLGLDVLQKMLLMGASFELAKKLLKKGYRPSEIPLSWFEELLFSDDYSVTQYAIQFIKKEYPKEQLEVSWFQKLIADQRMENSYYSYMARDYAQEYLAKHAAKLDRDWIKEALLDDNVGYNVRSWIEEGKIKPKQLDLDWFKSLLSPKAWKESAWVKQQEQKSERWVQDLDYPHSLQYFALSFLEEGEVFKPRDLGVEWLLSQLQEADESVFSFAESTLLRHYQPTDFASEEALAALPTQEAKDKSAGAENPFAGKTFLFTGKLRSLTRADAETKVAEIDGKIAKSVTKKLDYLVVGDEGSPLFSGGKKGSKITKAEEYQEQGLPVEIISETDWLQMISEGSAAKVDVDPRAVELGFARLFKMATAEDEHEKVREFGAKYLRARHPILGPKETGQPLTGEQVISREHYQASLFVPLFEDERQEAQELAIQIGRYELQRWKVPPTTIFAFCESPHKNIRRFAIDALMGPDPTKKEKDNFSFPPETLDPDLVFALAENKRREVRQAGLNLLLRHYDLLGGDSRILRLAESPDRDVRSQAVKVLWLRYRRSSVASGWSPAKDERAAIEPNASLSTIESQAPLLEFVRTVLFGLPPGRLQKRPKNVAKPWSNSKAKVHMIELIRDLALEDEGLYQSIRPLFEQFLASHHKMESLNCLVALTQLQHKWKAA